ncbi:AT-rich interactive domain-containing protein 6-like [Cynara cardunculus var. scolymus]|uniref:AT-rich interactive domain-containing protein 6-like n=1 Tax=Cynara cardunculus var. scolymus TaxID=59895 RepID=UPI000D62F97B|nr:AT-rich interactive domain-containing protein 6-like [Cynara cardunculus var. scolymus]
MDQRDVEMEDTEKLLEDEAVGDQECVGKDQLDVKEAGGKEEEGGQERVEKDQLRVKEAGGKEEEGGQECVEKDQLGVKEAGGKEEESSGLVYADFQNPDEIGVEQEKVSKKDEEDRHPDESEQELPVEETQDSEKDTTAKGDDKIDDSKKDATAMGDDHGILDEADHYASIKMSENHNEGDYTGDEKHQELATPNSLVKYSPSQAKDHSAETPKNELEDTKMDEGYESGTPDEQETFMKEVEAFYKEKSLEFKPPKFYGQPLNCLKLWRSVIKLGGYDRVTGSKVWRQVGESFHPPKTCTTVSWTFRQFYEKALLEYERHKVHNGEIELPLATIFPEAPTVEIEANGHQTPGSGRARRDAAARAMQGWHAQRLFGFGEEKNANNSQKREKSLKSIGSLKQKRPSEVENSVKAVRTETSRQVVTTVADVGPPANWVKINVRETKDAFEVYALVPGLLREEVRVQSDPAGRLVITGQPEQLDNPWGIAAFKKVISLPARIDPLRTSAIVSLHGRLLVRVPFEQSNI